MNILQKISLILTIIGAINWGLIGLFNFNLVDSPTNATATAIPIYIFFKIAPPLIKYVNLSILCIKLYFIGYTLIRRMK